jgi:RES domain-containing protein
VILWRISNHADLSGEGGRRASARWHTAGRPVVYLTSSPAAALVEVLVHGLTLDELPDTYQWLEIDVEAGARTERASTLPLDWPQDISRSRAIGDAWLARGATPLLEVPSAVVPKTRNYLFNPRHRDAGRVRIVSEIRYPLDRRLIPLR